VPELTLRDNARDKIEIILSSLFLFFFFVASLRDCNIRSFSHGSLDSIALESVLPPVNEYHIEKYNIVEPGTRAVCFYVMLSNAIQCGNFYVLK